MKLADLHAGDIIRHRHSGEAYIVIRTDPAIIAVRDVQVTNPREWEVIARSDVVTLQEEAELQEARDA